MPCHRCLFGLLLRSLRVCSVVGNKLSDAVECNMLAAECLNIAPAVAAKWSPNRIKNGAPNLENRRKIGSKLGPDTQKSEKTHQRNKEEGSIPQGPPYFAQNVANMASTWHPKSNQNR